MKVSASLLLLTFAALSPVRGQAPSASVDAPPASRLLLTARGRGVQVYTCAGEQNSMKWTLAGPDAKLLDQTGKIIGKHFAGPTWRLNDGSEVKGRVLASQTSPDPASAAWLLLTTVPGTATGKLAEVAYIRRSETHGGAAPKTGCDNEKDIGRHARVRYTASYGFYTR